MEEIQTTNMYMLEEMEYEDDAFYSELRKQVLQLTAEDEDEDEDEEVVYGNKNNVISMVAVRKGGLNHNWPAQSEEGVAAAAPAPAPAWIMNLWKTGNGTGVFIPQIVHTNKKNKPRKKRNAKGRTCKRVETN